jgi:hypothetical protein
MTRLRPIAASCGVVALACLVAAGMPAATESLPELASIAAPAPAAAVSALGLRPTPAPQSQIALAPAAAEPAAPSAAAPTAAEQQYYQKLGQQLRWVNIKFGNNRLLTPDYNSRLLLVKAAAERARLGEVGLTFADVYGIINAETSWVPRLGASKDGTPNFGIAQFEPATAKALGLSNPNDPVEAVHVMAEHIRDAAVWSARRIASLRLSPEQRAEKLREGISIYYNLSTKGRNQWNGRNTAKLPRETQLHISNARVGMLQAWNLQSQLRNVSDMVQQRGSDVADAGARSGS